MKVIGRVKTSIIRPIREMPLCVENLDPENNSSCVITAPIVPPLPVIPDITPNDLQLSHKIKTLSMLLTFANHALHTLAYVDFFTTLYLMFITFDISC